MTRGRRPLGEIPNRVNEDKWFQKIDWLKTPKSGDMKEIRFYGGAFTIVQHWIQFKNETGEIKRFAKLCPGFNFDEAEFYDDRLDRCVLCKHFNDRSLPKHLQFRPKFDYLEDAFDIEAIKNGSRGDVVGAVQINSYGLQDLQDAARSLQKRKDPELQHIDDNARGFSVMWKHNPNAKDAKNKQGFSEGDQLTIKYHKKREEFYLPESERFDYDGVWGPVTDFLDILVAPSSEEIEDDIKRLKLDVQYEEETGISVFGRRPSSAKQSSQSDWEEEGDEEPPARRARSRREEPSEEEAPPKRTRRRREAAPEEDGDWGGEEEKAPPKRTRKASSKDEDWDGDEEEKAPQRRSEEPAQESKDEDWDGDEEEKAPPKRTRRRREAAPKDDDWEETKDASASDDDWGDDPPPKRKSSNGRRRSKPAEEEETPPDNKRRAANKDDDDEDDWDPGPRRGRSSSESDDPPTRPSRRRGGRTPSRSSDWD
jgi:hypothetical protein